MCDYAENFLLKWIQNERMKIHTESLLQPIQQSATYNIKDIHLSSLKYLKSRTYLLHNKIPLKTYLL